MAVITHPITGKTITPYGIVGNIVPGGPDGYRITVSGANAYVDLSDAGKYVVAVGGEMQGGPYSQREAKADAAAWRESYPEAEIEVIEIVESWGTRSY